MKIDWVVIGAGFTGAVLAERLASQANMNVLVVDRRSHIAGNAFDCHDENGILIHRYGAHIFHTNSKRIWDHLSRFTDWREYSHEVLAMIQGKFVPVPFNLNSISSLFSQNMAKRLERLLTDRFGLESKVPILKLMDETEPEIKELAQFAYREVFENYTMKQWGLRPEQLDASVTARVPVYISRDNRYFQDTYQGIPKHGYTELFRRMLSHKNIHILLNTDYREIIEEIGSTRVIFTGPIDEFFGYCHGPLPYRSLRFEFSNEPVEQLQKVAVINYPNDHQFTRIIEFKHFSGQESPNTTITREYPEKFVVGSNEPYYPIPRQENRDRHALYAKEAQSLDGRILFAGRLADYKYYNMDQAAGRALSMFDAIMAQSDKKPQLPTMRADIRGAAPLNVEQPQA